MVLDKKVLQAIDDAVERHGQSERLAHLLKEWLEAIASGDELLHDANSDAAAKRLEEIYEATIVGESGS